MNKRYKDTDLREALHRKYADTPQLPADFMAKMEHRMDAKPVAKTRRLWPWVAVAASFLLIIGIGLTMMPTEQQPKTEAMVAQNTKKAPAIEQPSESERPFLSQRKAVLLIRHDGLSVRRLRTKSPLVTD